MAISDQIGLDTNGLQAHFPDLKRLEAELEARFGLQSLRTGTDFALTQL